MVQQQTVRTHQFIVTGRRSGKYRATPQRTSWLREYHESMQPITFHPGSYQNWATEMYPRSLPQSILEEIDSMTTKKKTRPRSKPYPVQRKASISGHTEESISLSIMREEIQDFRRSLKSLRDTLEGSEDAQRWFGQAVAKGEDCGDQAFLEDERKMAAGLVARVGELEKGKTASWLGISERALKADLKALQTKVECLERTIESKADALWRDKAADRKDSLIGITFVGVMAAVALLVALN